MLFLVRFMIDLDWISQVVIDILLDDNDVQVKEVSKLSVEGSYFVVESCDEFRNVVKLQFIKKIYIVLVIESILLDYDQEKLKEEGVKNIFRKESKEFIDDSGERIEIIFLGSEENLDFKWLVSF